VELIVVNKSRTLQKTLGDLRWQSMLFNTKLESKIPARVIQRLLSAKLKQRRSLSPKGQASKDKPGYDFILVKLRKK
jgi:hypothetical protein